VPFEVCLFGGKEKKRKERKGNKRKKNLFFLVDGFGLLLIRILNFYTIWVHEFVSSINFTLVSALKYVILW
jgi:hypothetical protein